MRFFPHLALGCGAVSLAACVATPTTPLDRLLQSTLAQPLVPHSVMREGDLLSFEMLVPTGNNVLRSTIQFEAACSSPDLHLLYVDGLQRVYPAAARLYSPARALNSQLYATLAANPTFTQACAQTPKSDWRRVKVNDNDKWVLLDRSSITVQNGETRFWAAFDYPAVLNDVPYNAPYAQKREHYAMSCTAATVKLLAGYDLDAHNRVTDGRVDGAPTAEPVASDPDYQLLFEQVCGAKERTAQLPPFEPRHKAPLTVALQSVDPGVLAAIKQLDLDPPAHTFNYLRTLGTSNFKGKSSLMGQERFIKVDAASKQLSIVTRGKDYESQSVDWRGLIALVSKTDFNLGRGIVDGAAASQLSFSGDWKNLPVGATVGYTVSTTTVNSLVGSYGGKPKTTRCVVEREVSASELHPALSGRAKVLSCSTTPDEYQRVDHQYYLSDYGYFFHTSTDENRFYYDDSRIEAVE
jgi:hypothetical protein